LNRRDFFTVTPIAFLGVVTGRFSTDKPNMSGTPFIARGEDGRLYSAVMEPLDEAPKAIGIMVNSDNTTNITGTLKVEDDVVAFGK
jgi:hypothetical protein